ncbi:MAG: gas vesicle protein GvpR [Firmicutes bacterium]|nr:gas vesicle protein GvpR [Bacillota bacterium]
MEPEDSLREETRVKEAMHIGKGLAAVGDFFARIFGDPGRIICFTKADNGWRAQVEVVEEGEYMRRYGRYDLLGVYEVDLSEGFDVTGYRRIGFRERTEAFNKAQEADM